MRPLSQILVVLPALIILLAVSAMAAPGAVVENNDQNLGRILEGQKPEVTFTIANDGDENLQLLGVRATCGCTVAEIETDSVAPGRTGKIKVTFDSRGYSGKIRKIVTVSTNDPAHGRLRLGFEGEVLTRFSIEPSVIYLRDVDQDKGKIAELIFEDNTDDNIEITDLSVDDRRLTVRVIKLSRPGSRYRAKIVVTIPPGLPEGSFDTHLKIRTNDSLVPGDSVYIIGKIIKNRQ
jgi:Protein of unknown function (DUF1573)